MRTLFLSSARTAAILALAVSASPALAQTESIKIGDINSYSGMALFTEPYRKGAQLAIEQVNAAGGVLGRRLEVVYRDDAVKAGDAVRHAEELVSSEKVSALAGGFTSSVCLALADFAQQRKRPFVCGIAVSDAVVWEKGNRFTFRTAQSTTMQAGMLAEAAAKLPARRWATVAPNYEYGTSFVTAFKTRLSALRPDVVWVSEQWPALGKMDPGPTIDALNANKPEAIFNVTFGTDLVRLVREGNTRGFFRDKVVVSALTGQPEYLDSLKDETPEGWIVTGYPWQSFSEPDHVAFRKAYEAKFKDYPRWGSVLGYTTYMALAGAIQAAGSTDGEKIADAFRGLTIKSPLGPVTYRASDHQSTIPFFVGKLVKKDRNGLMTDWRMVRGEDYLPAPDVAAALRPKN